MTGVTVKASTTIQVGGTEQLTATIAPADATDQSVTWTSSDATVATVSAAGLVTAVNAGTATITVTTADGDKTATCAVTVTAAVVAVSSVTLNQSALSLVDGATATLTATILPSGATNQSLIWTTSSSTVASISSTSGGTITVTAAAVGTATITATSAADSTKLASCTVTVSANVTPVASVTLDQSTLALTVGGTASLNATVLPASATDPTLVWTTSDSTIASISSTSGSMITVTAVGSGTATLTATSHADSSKHASCTVTVAAAVTPVSSVTLGQSTLALTVGGTSALSATVLPAGATNPSLTWSTSAATIASISATSGGSITVTAVAAGTATITATSNADGTKSASCTVTVSAASGSSDANLTALVLLDATTTLSPAFAAGTTSYTASVASVVPSVRVQATLDDAVNATMTVNGTAATSGTATTGIGLTAGANTLSIVVTAQNGSTKTYTVTVTQAAPVNVTPASWTGAVADLFGSSGTTPSGSIGNNQPTTLTLTAAGGEVNSTNRRFYIAYSQVTGDFQLTAQLASITGTFTEVANNAFRYGLFMTENINVADVWADSARFAELGYYTAAATPTLTPSRGYKLDVGTGSTQSRSDISSTPLVTGMSVATAATVYLRLTRLSNKFVTSFSTDNATYTVLNTSTFTSGDMNSSGATTPIANTWDVGFFGAPKDSLTFTYDNISIIQ